ncbi:hypothetical protein QN375_06010 [Pseudomonas sp. MH9.2]|nr:MULTISPECIES: hypothetical protein [unclassified Pseudomonas]MEB0009334.1 hypothetical protein [Pseudomonas sp. RTB2]MEB0018296.1 hypothetical protein [Pseudomonas sp. RTB3]MEB0025326.1 hypothetical protein [Pseudomonas sp. MH9.2]MEB0147175.1 hypothetical protein [Pseudomonas sp. CCC2.2]MEB0268517.1 hypothetical protein [Pseudomonas sp. 5B4]
MTHQVYFPPQYGNLGGWYACTVDQFGVWRCNGMYMPAPSADRIK